jgi:exodeoxyribonuclease V
MTTWSPQQDAALKAVAAWLRNPGRQQVFRLFGFAGTGKTTLAQHFAEGVDGPVLFGAFTGKAAHVMHRKGCRGARTVHSLIYKLDDDQMSYEPKFRLNPDSDVAGADLVIIDEVSMVGEDLGRDLLSFGTPVLVLGDPAQLPPVKGQGFFTEAEPDVMLTEVHRQAAESPIIRLATTIRTGGMIEIGDYGDARVIARADVNAVQVLEADQILVGRNQTRHAYNRRYRDLRGLTTATPGEGEKLVCLRNDREKRLLNGSIWTVSGTKKPNGKDRADNTTRLVVRPEEAPADAKGVNVKVKNEFWTGEDGDLDWNAKRGTDEFTYGYALTVHKAQGSQWDNVIIFDEAAAFREDAWRWRYTALTRAARQLTWVAA